MCDATLIGENGLLVTSTACLGLNEVYLSKLFGGNKTTCLLILRECDRPLLTNS